MAARNQGFLKPHEPSPAEYSVRLARKTEEKTYHIMRFKSPHTCDLEKLINPTLERQVLVKTEVEVEELPETGEGSEYGRKRREEARRRRRGYNMRAPDPDAQPWVLKEKKKGGKHYIGRKEGTVNSSSSFFIFKFQDNVFEVEPIKNWYDFVPPVKYNYLDAEEAEERFEKRNKTLNYFSVMLSKKLKDSEEGEEGASAGMGDVGKDAKVKEKKKAAAVDSGLMLTDSDSGDFSSENDSDGSSGSKHAAKEVSKKMKTKKLKKSAGAEEEAGEETDEGDMESREVDYMSDSSSNSELEFLAKEANKELPKDDQEVERKEEEEIDKGFVDSSSSEDELTEKGKELRELMKKLSGGENSGDEGGDEEEEEEEEGGGEGEPMETDSPKPKAKGTGTRSDSPVGKKGKHSSKSSKHSSRKRERASPGTSNGGSSVGSTVGDSGKRSESPSTSSATSASQPPEKKQKTEVSTTSISEDEVKRYLMRRPITSTDLVKKFISKKTDMDKNRIVEVLHKIIEGLKNVQKQQIKKKLYLSLSKDNN